MDGTPADISLPDVARALEQLDGVSDVHHIHGWALTSGRSVFSAHLRVNPDIDSQAILRREHKLLRGQFGFFFSTLQIETACLDEAAELAIDITHDADQSPAHVDQKSKKSQTKVSRQKSGHPCLSLLIGQKSGHPCLSLLIAAKVRTPMSLITNSDGCPDFFPDFLPKLAYVDAGP
jgi:hypothetical protein